MNIIAHRGLWSTGLGANSLGALKEAIDLNFGIETDIRDYEGKLVISHDIANEDSPSLDNFFELYKDCNKETVLALNVKADGIQNLLIQAIKAYDISNYFLFDMSIPEMVVYRAKELNFFTRNSDIEQECVLYDDAQGVWVDKFFSSWNIYDAIINHIKNGKKVSLISPEIHGEERTELWEVIKNSDLVNEQNFYLCTDLPLEARVFFGE